MSKQVSAEQELANLREQLNRCQREMQTRQAEQEHTLKIQAALYQIAAAASAAQDLQAFYAEMHQIIRERMAVAGCSIAVLDERTNLISYPYWVDKTGREAPPAEPLGSRKTVVSWVMRHGKVMDTRSPKAAEAIARGEMELPEQGSNQVAVPLTTGAKTIGALLVQWADPALVDTVRDVDFLTFTAHHIAATLKRLMAVAETRHLLKETEDRASELTVINEIQQGLAAELSFQAIIDMVGDKLREVLKTGEIGIRWYESETNLMHYLYEYEHGTRIFIPSQPPQGLIWQEQVRTRKPVIVSNPEEIQRFGILVIPGTDLSKSLAYIPIIGSDRVLGSIVLENYERENAFTEADIRLLTTVASSVGVALENALLFEQTQHLLKEAEERNAELVVINSVGEAISRQLDVHTLSRTVGDKITQIFKAEATSILMLDTKTNMIFPVFEWDEGMYLENVESFPLGTGLTSQVIHSRQPLVLGTAEEAAAHGAYYPPAAAEENPTVTQSYLGVPIIVGENIIGVVSVHAYTKNAYNQDSVRLLSTIANNLGVALENARLFSETSRLLEETRQRNTELSTVNTISHALVAETELETLIQLTGKHVRQTFNADIAYVALLNSELGSIYFPYVYGEEFSAIQLGEGLTSRIIETGQPLLINKDLQTQETTLGITPVGKEALSFLGVPIIVGKQAIGVISVQSTQVEGRFTQRDINLLSTLAANVGAAIHNANSFNEINYQRKYYETIFANSPAAIVVLDEQMKISGWNPAAERLFRYTQAEAMGHDIDDLIANQEEIHAEAVAASERGMVEGGVRLISRRTRKNGSLVDVEIAALPVILDGRQTGYIVIYHDITEIQRARQEAITANQAKSAFLANMSHELRTPLNAIIGFTRIVRRKGQETLPEKQVENLDKVLISAEHLLGLINTVLDISKIEAGRMDVNPVTFALPPLVNLILSTSQPLVRPGVRLKTLMPANLPSLFTDQDMIKQILLNLLSNAAKFTHEGQITLSARVKGNCINIDLRDTGIGISANAQKLIFDEFQQADSSTTRKYGGTGLGLAISRKLARLLGGDLSVKSQEGVGSIFTLSIPLQYDASQAPLPALETTGQPGKGDDRSVVLVIDDNPDVHILLQENLGDAGYRVVNAHSGDEGIQKAHDLTPFAIILDIIMPHKDGWQVLHELKTDPHTRDIPVILLTIVDKKALGYRLGASDYLVKPLDEETILAALQRLEQSRVGEPVKRLLVVDDDPNVVDLIRQLLANTSIHIDSAEDGLSALDAIREKMPDAILVDLIMPRLDGFSLIAELEKDSQFKDIPIILLTAKTLARAERKIMQEKVTRITEKNGLDKEKLVKDIQHILAKYAS